MHLEAIKLEQRKIFDKLRYFPEFYLAGGTALALQIGHRISIDFDLFYPKELPKGLLKKVKKIFKSSKIKIEVDNPEQLTFVIDNTGLTFVRYVYSIIFSLVNFQGIKLLSVPEIAATKGFTLGRRATFKDYVDLYFILKGKSVTLEEIINICEKKYAREFNSRLFLEQITYLEDVREAPIEFLREKVSKKQLQEFFDNEIKKIKL